MKIGLASDHKGFKLKNELTDILKEKGHDIIDYGTNSIERTDYPIYAFNMCHGVINKNIDLGIAICGTGIGMSIASNKVKGIRCAKIDNEIDAKYSKNHNNANVLAFSSSKTKEELTNYIDIFLNEQINDEEKYKYRNDLIKRYEDEH